MAEGALQDTAVLSRTFDNLAKRLRTQREQLRKLGMDVPPGSLKHLEQVHLDLEEIGPKIDAQNNELERLRALADSTSVMNSSLDLEVVLTSVMDTVLEMTEAERGYIMLRNEKTGGLEPRVARGMEHQDLDGDKAFVSKTIVQHVASSSEPIVTTNAQQDDRFSNQQSIVGYNLRSILCVPLVIKGEVEGVIYADNRIKDGLFGDKELQLLVAIGSQAALAIENAKLFKQARSRLEEITNLKTLQDNILASIASGVITCDALNNITTYNVGAESIFGLSSSQTFGQSFDAAVPALYQLVKELLPAVRERNESITLEADAPNAKQEVRSLNLKLSPLKDSTDSTHGVALVVDDLTDLKRRDAMLQAVRRYLPPAMVENIQSIENIGLGGVRRTVTVMFVDVRPFHTFPAQLSASEQMELLNTYLTAGTDTIHRKSGLVDKYMGNEIMALFNTQLNPSDNHALDAVHAAIDIVHDFKTLYEQLGDHPKTPYYRIGIHTGVATLGNVGGKQRREFSVLGDTVNLAKRLEENAQQGQIIISQDTYAACGDALSDDDKVELIEHAALQVKGRSQATRIFELRQK
jgi:PAS domain S-box-containing protein